MKSILVALALVFTAPALAQSAHPRVGELATILFDRGSAKLAVTADSVAGRELGEAAGWTLDNPDGLLVIDGHADQTGSKASNIKLSLDRAKAVRDQLIAIGVDPDRLVIAAFGESGPQKPDRARNRKVVVWGTRAGLDAVVARSFTRGYVVIWSGIMTEADRRPQPGAVATQ